MALLTALADISGAWTLHQVTEALSRFADAATDIALDLALRELVEKDELLLDDPENPGPDLRPNRARHGQARRIRTQLFQRHPI